MHISLIGRLTKDLTDKGSFFLTSIAYNYRNGGENKTVFINALLKKGTLSEGIIPYLVKGRTLLFALKATDIGIYSGQNGPRLSFFANILSVDFMPVKKEDSDNATQESMQVQATPKTVTESTINEDMF